MIEIAESPISKTGNSEWDDTFNECFYENAKTVMWPHSLCMTVTYMSHEEKNVLGAVEKKKTNHRVKMLWSLY